MSRFGKLLDIGDLEPSISSGLHTWLATPVEGIKEQLKDIKREIGGIVMSLVGPDDDDLEDVP